MSLKNKNKVSLKKRIREERKELDSAKRKKKSIEAKSREKKIKMKKRRECNISKHLSFYTKESENKNAYFSDILMILLMYKEHILILTILILLSLVLLYLCYSILRMI